MFWTCNLSHINMFININKLQGLEKKIIKAQFPWQFLSYNIILATREFLTAFKQHWYRRKFFAVCH